MKKTIKILSVLIMTVMIIATFASFVLAADISVPTGTTISNTDVNKVANYVIGFLRVIGTAVAVVIIIVLGIKYLTASPEGKADYKSSMIPYLVGAVLVFAGTWIASGIINSINNINS